MRLIRLCTEKDEKRFFLFPQFSPPEFYSLLHPEKILSSQNLGVSLGFRLPRHLVIQLPRPKVTAESCLTHSSHLGLFPVMEDT